MERSDHAACLTEVACGWHEKSMMPDVQAVQMPILGHKTASRSGLSVYSAVLGNSQLRNREGRGED